MTTQTETPTAMTKQQAWIHAMRPRTLPLALSSIGMGIFLAAAAGLADWPVAIFCILTTIFLQILSNLANDYGDSKHGADSITRRGPQRSVQMGLITAAEMKRAMFICASLAMVSGVILV
ncbi:MAG: UbiA family prenyltransferase, partial [Anaerolineales bacterium]|nr:UbiA family prenyltransferase [Anaerolineales bacterium]